MAIKANPVIVRDGLVLALDAGNPSNYNLTAVEYLIVGGGGAGGTGEANPGGDGAGGGGAGGVLTNVGGTPLSISSSQSYNIIVGNGGVNASGGISSAFGLTALGGGKGGNQRNAGVSSGGSGGGAGGNCNDPGGPRTGGDGTAGQGNRGGNDLSTGCSLRGGRGGGGAGSAAADAASAEGTSGGNGIVSYISGTETYYAGGGGGGRGASNSVGGLGGLGGGGSGSNGTASPVAGTTNTGGGGGGGASYSSGVPAPGQGANGGSGIVIVRYPGTQKALGGTVSYKDGFTIHTFTTVGVSTFTPLSATNNASIAGLGDLSGRGNGGTSVNGPTYSSSNGGSIVFDGTNDRIDLPFSSVFDISGSITMEGFIYPTAYKVGGGGGGMLITKVASYYSELQSDGKIRAYFYGLSSPGYHTSNATVSLNTWTHFVVVRDVSASTIVFYLNGVLDRTVSSITGNITVQQTYPVTLGSYSGSTYEYTGRIANAKIYNRALTASEIAQNYYATKSRYGL